MKFHEGIKKIKYKINPRAPPTLGGDPSRWQTGDEDENRAFTRSCVCVCGLFSHVFVPYVCVRVPRIESQDMIKWAYTE